MKPREFLSKVGATITSNEASIVLNLTPSATSKVLNRWVGQGWINRVVRGIYVPSTISTVDKNPMDEKFVAVNAIIAQQGYICGWSATEYWGMTEQIFRDISIASFKWPRSHMIDSPLGAYQIFKIDKQPGIGLTPVWCHDKRIFVSDVHMTIVDILSHPIWGGGMLHVVDCLYNYIHFEAKDFEIVLHYAQSVGAKGVFYKRLGFLLEKLTPDSNALIEKCHQKISKGYTFLDPQISIGKLCRRWQLIIPKNIKLGTGKI